ncbi:MAG: hydroxyacyl-ACP dehydratase HTD2-like protein with hotdog domain [Acidimicrobiales bacterium]|jgi:hydroxyacyl-ACP dehydratase HTD2-like protein with hotdog domain
MSTSHDTSGSDTNPTDADETGPRVLMSAPAISEIMVGDVLPQRHHTPTNVSLFLYNAAVWNPHRIHYDAAYATEGEGHAGIVIDGPLQGDWITQTVLNWLGPDGDLVRFSYQNRLATHLGETLVSGGTVMAVDVAARLVRLDLFVANDAGTLTTPGTATVLLAS